MPRPCSGRRLSMRLGDTRAMLGLRQAALRLADGDAAGTSTALSRRDHGRCRPRLRHRSRILGGRAEARLAPARSRRRGAAGAWAGGRRATVAAAGRAGGLAGAATGTCRISRAAALPASPAPLDERQRRLVLRQAALLALAGDEAGLAALREWRWAAHGRGSAERRPSRLLTADQLRGLADLPRLQRELQLFRALPSRLEALRAGGPVTR